MSETEQKDPQKLAALASDVPIGLYTLDDGVRIWGSEAFERIVPEGQNLEHWLSNIRGKELFEKVKQRIEKKRKYRHSWDYTQGVRPLRYQICFSPTQWHEKPAVRVFLADRTGELEQEALANTTQKALKQQNHFLQSLYQSITDYLVTVRQDGTVVSLNPAAAEMFDGQYERILNQDFIQRLKPADGTKTPSQGILELLRNGTLTNTQYLIDTGKRAEPLPVQLSGIPLDSQKTLIVMTNISELMELAEEREKRAAAVAAEQASHARAEELERLNKQLEETQLSLAQSSRLSAIGEMAGGIAHEINNPLAVILGQADIIERNIKRPEINRERLEKSIHKIHKGVERISHIVKGLLRSVRGDSQEMKTCALSVIVEDTLSFCEARLKGHSIRLQVSELDPNLTVECQAVQISQVLLNLLNNASQAIEEQKEKWIRLDLTSPDPNTVELSVTDSGPGIPDSLREKIMSPLFTTKEVGKGTGLGLSISKNIAETHHGKLTVDPTCPNTRFVLTLPKRQPKTKTEPTPEKKAA